MTGTDKRPAGESGRVREEALAGLQRFIERLQDTTRPLPTREEAAEALVAVYAGIIAAPTRASETRAHEAVRALAALGGSCQPMDLGSRLDPRKEGYHAGALGSSRLELLRQAGLVRRVHFGWWTLTDAGRALAGRLGAEIVPRPDLV